VVWFGFYKAVPRDHRRIEEELKRRAAEVP
jgi:hypothetical protein